MAKKILLFGYYSPSGARTYSVRRWLEQQGHSIYECWTERRGFFPKLRDLWNTYRSGEQCDAVLVAYPAQYLVPFTWFFSKHLIADVFLSLYETYVEDRRLLSRWHPRAWMLWVLDWLSCHLPKEILVDTEANKQFFIERFGADPKKITVVYLEAPPMFQSMRRKTQDVRSKTVLFYGTFIPLQGIEYILEAAAELPDIQFTLLGRGQMYPAMRKYAEDLDLTNVLFEDPIPYEELPNRIHQADLCLGIFGTSPKAQRVIPHKVIESVACGVPVITADTPGIRERFFDHPLVHLTPTGDSQALSQLITRFYQ